MTRAARKLDSFGTLSCVIRMLDGCRCRWMKTCLLTGACRYASALTSPVMMDANSRGSWRPVGSDLCTTTAACRMHLVVEALEHNPQAEGPAGAARDGAVAGADVRVRELAHEINLVLECPQLVSVLLGRMQPPLQRHLDSHVQLHLRPALKVSLVDTRSDKAPSAAAEIARVRVAGIRAIDLDVTDRNFSQEATVCTRRLPRRAGWAWRRWRWGRGG